MNNAWHTEDAWYMLVEWLERNSTNPTIIYYKSIMPKAIIGISIYLVWFNSFSPAMRKVKLLYFINEVNSSLEVLPNWDLSQVILRSSCALFTKPNHDYLLELHALPTEPPRLPNMLYFFSGFGISYITLKLIYTEMAFSPLLFSF